MTAPRSWWQRLNEKPKGFDEPKQVMSRIIQAIFLGVGLFLVRKWFTH